MFKDIAFFTFSTEEDISYVLEFSGLILTGRSFEVKIKDRASNTTRATLTNGSGLTITGTNVLEAAYALAGMASWPRGEYSADVVDVTGGSHARVMAVRFVLDLPGRLVQGVQNRKAFINWSPNQAVVTATGAIGPAGPKGDKGDKGDQGDVGNTGPAGQVAVGTVTTGAPGSAASVTNVGTPENAILNFSIPEGEKGDTGDAATIAVGTVTTGSPSAPATVTNVGTSGAAIFDFTIPKGDKGDKGDPGTATIVDGNKGDITTSDSGDTWTINGGYVPKTGGDFTGPTGVTGAAGTYRPFDFKTGTSLRWRLNADNQAEAGGNAGSDFAIARFDDAGNYIENSARIGRGDGVLYLPRRPNWGATPYDTNNLALSVFGQSLVDDANAASARVTLGANSDGSDIFTGATTIGKALGTAASAAAGRSAINAPPLPQGTSGVGQWTSLSSASGANLVLPSGGTWAWWALAGTGSGTISATVQGGVAAGGTSVQSGVSGSVWTGACWRIA